MPVNTCMRRFWGPCGAYWCFLAVGGNVQMPGRGKILLEASRPSRLLKRRRENEATAEELEYLNLLTVLLEDYERKRLSRQRERFSPAEMLACLMEENGLKQTDLRDVASQSNISAMLRGKRPIGKTVAQKLAQRFQVGPELLL